MKHTDETINILGFEIITQNREELLNTIAYSLKKGSGHSHLLALNAIKVCKAHKDMTLGDAVRNAAIVYPDGFGVAWAMRKKSEKRFDNIPGCELFLDILEIANTQKSRVYVLGATESVITETRARFQKDFPDVIICGMRHGFFANREDRKSVLFDIVKENPEILFVAMGSPNQEKVITDIFEICRSQNLQNLMAMGLGGSLDIYTGRIQRAPRVFIQLRLEWFYRFITQPFYRISNTLLVPKFASLFLLSHYFKYPKY